MSTSPGYWGEKKQKKNKRNYFEAPDTLCVPTPLLKSMLSRSKAEIRFKICLLAFEIFSALPFGAGIL